MLINCVHVKSLVFVKGDGKLRAVLVRQVFVDDKRYGVNFSFYVAVFTLVDAQSEHQFRVSAGPYFGFAHTHDSLIVFGGDQRAQLVSDCTLHGNLHCLLSPCRGARERGLPIPRRVVWCISIS
jgi:hypothetical protein